MSKLESVGLRSPQLLHVKLNQVLSLGGGGKVVEDKALYFLAGGGGLLMSHLLPEPRGPYCQKCGSHSAILSCKLLTCHPRSGSQGSDGN